MLTVLCSSSNISGAIQPSVPAAPDLRENDIRPAASFLQRPKSDIMTRIWPLESGWDSKTLCGFISLWTAKISKVLDFQTLWPEIYIYWILFYYAYQHVNLHAFLNKLMQSFMDKQFKIYEVQHWHIHCIYRHKEFTGMLKIDSTTNDKPTNKTLLALNDLPGQWETLKHFILWTYQSLKAFAYQCLMSVNKRSQTWPEIRYQ